MTGRGGRGRGEPQPVRGLGRPAPGVLPPPEATAAQARAPLSQEEIDRLRAAADAPSRRGPAAGLTAAIGWALPDYSVVVADDAGAAAIAESWGLDLADSAAHLDDAGHVWEPHGARRLVTAPAGEPVVPTALGVAWALARRDRRSPAVALVPRSDPQLDALLELAARWHLRLLVVCEPGGSLTDRDGPRDDTPDLAVETVVATDLVAVAGATRQLCDPEAAARPGLLLWRHAEEASQRAPAGPSTLGSQRRRDAAADPSTPGRADPASRAARRSQPPGWASGDAARIVLSQPGPGVTVGDPPLPVDIHLPPSVADLGTASRIVLGMAVGEIAPVMIGSSSELFTIVGAVDALSRWSSGHRSQITVVAGTTARPATGSLALTPSQRTDAVLAAPTTLPALAAALRDRPMNGPLIVLEPAETAPPGLRIGDDGEPALRARPLRNGTDVTLVSHGAAVGVCLAAAGLAEERGVSVTVLDLGVLQPLDEDAVLDAVRRTGRCLVVEDGSSPVTMSAAISALVADRAFAALRAPVGRLMTGPDDAEAVAGAIDRLTDQAHASPADSGDPGS